jgi:putative ATP-grasp target RiPP
MQDRIWRAADQFPLGSGPRLAEIPDEPPSTDAGARPFGLRYVNDCPLADHSSIDWATLHYDEERQIAMVADDGVILPAFKHTSNQTSTSTGDQDRRGADKDTDVGGD